VKARGPRPYKGALVVGDIRCAKTDAERQREFRARAKKREPFLVTRDPWAGYVPGKGWPLYERAPLLREYTPKPPYIEPLEWAWKEPREERLARSRSNERRAPRKPPTIAYGLGLPNDDRDDPLPNTDDRREVTGESYAVNHAPAAKLFDQADEVGESRDAYHDPTDAPRPSPDVTAATVGALNPVVDALDALLDTPEVRDEDAQGKIEA
jgi:hypothetical protein